MKAALLPDRSVIKVSGPDARGFLNGLLTSDITRVSPVQAAFAALLTPQGKIIADTLVTEAPEAEGGGFMLDVPRAWAGDLVTKLTFYKLRAKVQIENLSESLAVMALWDGASQAGDGLDYQDPRLPALGRRIILPPGEAQTAATVRGAEMVDIAAYEAHRISLGVPRGGFDFTYGDAFPHEADMDQLGGVDFGKGCYVGQEVVSRMEHRGTARTRIVPVTTDGEAPEPGLPVMAGEKRIGTTGSSHGNHALAMLRLDRLADALASGQTIEADGVALRPRQPSWAKFPVPNATLPT